MRTVFLSVLSLVIAFGIPRAVHEFRSLPAIAASAPQLSPQKEAPVPAAQNANLFIGPAAQAVLASLGPVQLLRRAPAAAPGGEQVPAAKMTGKPEAKQPEDAPPVLAPMPPAAAANEASANAKAAAAQPVGDDRDYLPPPVRAAAGRGTSQAAPALYGGQAEEPRRARRRHHRAGRHARERRGYVSYRQAPSRTARRSRHRF